MPRIYPDTNRFIDLYQAAQDKIEILDKLENYASSIVLTEQTITEFRRNRVGTLSWLSREFEKSLTVNPYTTSLLRALPGHDELTKISAEYKSKGREILTNLRAIIVDETKDPVAQNFLKLAKNPSILTLPITDDAITSAHKRKLLGNPPSSPDKHTIGDELIWELLCRDVKEDLIVVTKDKTFKENTVLLSEEFKARTGQKLLLITDSFVEAIQLTGATPPKELVQVEAEEKKQALQPPVQFTPKQLRRMRDKEICPKCEKKGKIWGFDGSDGDFFDCFSCGHCGFDQDLALV